MSNTIKVIEGRSFNFHLHHDEAMILAAIGRKLASTQGWWGENNEDKHHRSVIHLTGTGTGTYSVQFKDVIGLIQLGNRQIEVGPKIPIEHFLYLVHKSEIAARLTTSSANLNSGSAFIELLATWYLNAAETLIKQELRKDYQEIEDELQEVRGSIHIIPTTQLLTMGKPAVICSHDELTIDSALNRVVLGACRRIAQLNLISETTRRRARNISFRMDGVGIFKPSDLRVTVDRISKNYRRIIPLAKLLLTGCGISLSSGNYQGTSFLIRTPEIIENGYRAVVSEALPQFKVVKQRQLLGDTGLTMNPDLVIENGIATGDIKYKLLTSHWNKPDLNQAVAFASAFRSKNCAVFGFVSSLNAPIPKSVPVGNIKAQSFAWIASDSISPQEAATILSEQVKKWCTSLIDGPIPSLRNQVPRL